MTEVKYTERCKKYMAEVAKEYSYVFAFFKEEIGRTNVAQHEIYLMDHAKPV